MPETSVSSLTGTPSYPFAENSSRALSIIVCFTALAALLSSTLSTYTVRYIESTPLDKRL